MFCSESFRLGHSPDILALCETNLDHSIDSRNSPEIFYYLYAWSCNLCERRTSFCMGLMFLIGFTLLSVLLLFPLLINFIIVHSFDSISSNLNEVFSINAFANVFVLGDFNIHPKKSLTYSGGTDRPDKLL